MTVPLPFLCTCCEVVDYMTTTMRGLDKILARAALRPQNGMAVDFLRPAG